MSPGCRDVPVAATCWHSVCVYKLEGSYSQTFAKLKVTAGSPSHDCLETGCLPPGVLCSRLTIRNDRPEVEDVAHTSLLGKC